MEQIELVVKVPKDYYETLKMMFKNYEFSKYSNPARVAILKGIPLPKGHGRLIDADRMKRWIENCECCSNCKTQRLNCNQDCKYPDYLDDVWERAINEQLTIVEADKEGAEE